MRNFGGIIIVGIIAVVLLFNALGSSGSLRGISGSNPADTYENLPSEPDRSEIIDTIENSEAIGVEQLVQQGFPLLDTVKTDTGRSKVYMTKELKMSKVAELLSEKFKPEEISERSDGKQILVYDDLFVILQESEEEQGLILIELSSDEFVKNNYAPSFFNGLLTYAILNNMLNRRNWASNRQARCSATGNCYGGYKGYSRGSGSFRGSSNRGGGPGSGK